MPVVLGKLINRASFWTINYMVTLRWYFQIEFQGNGVKHYWVTMWNGVKAVTNVPKQVVKCGNSMKNLSIHCTAKKKKKSNSDFVQHKQMFIGHQLCATIKNLNWQKQIIKPPQQTKQTTIELVFWIDLIGLCLARMARSVPISLEENEVNESSTRTRLHFSKCSPQTMGIRLAWGWWGRLRIQSQGLFARPQNLPQRMGPGLGIFSKFSR